MTLDELKNIVDKKNKEIDVEYKPSDGFIFCSNFVDNNSFSTMEDFMNLDVYEACKCLYYIYNKDEKTMKECIDFIDSFKDYFKEQDEDEFKLFVDMLFYFDSFNDIEPIIEILEETNGVKAKTKMRMINFCDPRLKLSPMEQADKNKDHYRLLSELRHIRKDCNVALLLKEVRKNNELMSLILGLIKIQKQMLFEKDIFLDLLEESSIKKKNTSGAKKYLKEYLKCNFKTKSILSDLSKISKYVTEEEYKKNNHNRQVEKEIRNNNQAFEVLSAAAKKDEITDARSIVKRVKDEELKNYFLKFIYNHNMKYYVELDEKLEKIRGNRSNLYLDELCKYGLLSNEYDVIEFMHNDIDDFKKILSFVSKLGISKMHMINILKYTTIEIVRKIEDYVRDGYLNINYVRDNIEIFAPKDEKLSIINNNVNLLDSNGINPKLLIDFPEILLMDSSLLVKNIKLLDDYQLKSSIRSTDNYHFMLDMKLEEKLDKLVELGYGDFLENDLDLLNYAGYKRLEILKSMNIPITSIGKIKEILETDKFIVDEDSLEEYIPSAVSYSKKQDLLFDLNDLEENRIDKRSYSINGVIISSNKVRRLLDEGYDMYDSIFYNTNLSQDEYNSVLGLLKQYTK